MSVKPGYKTTELYAVLLSALNTLGSGYFGTHRDVLAALGANVAAGLYAIGRGLAKRPGAFTVTPTAPPALTQNPPTTAT